MPFVYPTLKSPILIKNDSLTSEDVKATKHVVNISYVGRVMRISVEYGKTLICKGLTVTSILITLTSNTYNLFYICDIYKQLFVLYSLEVRLFFLIKIEA